MEAYVDAKEYQKRGLPHDHTTWWADEIDKIKSPEDIDKYVCAELPDPDKDKDLYDLVTKFMLHGPCTREKPCMQTNPNKCSKGFPKPFCEKTKIVNYGFPEYRRRDDGRFVVKNGRVFTNQHVVSYNPYLLKRFKCHINVEYCGSLRSIAYIMKYVCKGNDKVAGVIEPPPNVQSTNIPPPVDLRQTFINDDDEQIVDEVYNTINNSRDLIDSDDEQAEIPLHDNEQDLYADPNQLQQLIDNPADDFVDIPNYLDDYYAPNRPVDLNNNNIDINNIGNAGEQNNESDEDDNFNRPRDFIAYDEIKQYVGMY